MSYDCVTIDNDLIRFENHYKISEQESVNIIIYYKGIRDYSLLFPTIISANQSLALRLGLFYEEAEKSFENSAWLSYVLNCGAIFEGLLFHKLNANEYAKFNDLIKTALEGDFINTETAQIMHNAREKRNLIHAGRYTDPFITRLEAMDIMKVMDNVILNFR